MTIDVDLGDTEIKMTDFDELDELLSTSYEINNAVNRGSAEKPAQDFLTADLFSSMTDDEVMTHFMPIRGIDYDPNYLNDDRYVKKEKEESSAPVYMADEFLPYRMIPHLNPAYQMNAELFKNVVPTHRAREVINFQPPNLLKQQQQPQQCKAELPPRLCVEETETEKIANESVPSPPDVKTVNGMTAMHDDVEEMHVDVEEAGQDDDDEDEEEERHTMLPPKDCPRSSPHPPPAKRARDSNNRKDASKGAKEPMMDDGNKQEPRQIMKRKPRTYKYNPKPLQQKVNRAFVPDDLKDVDYWERRKRNNEAAKKSRKERREKELEIVNNYEEMRREFQSMKNENVRLKARNAVLEKQIKELKEQK